MLDLRWNSLFNELSCSIRPVPMNVDSIRLLLKTGIKPHGIVFSGGNNVSEIESTPENCLRDECEALLYNYALIEKIPLLGICRGMQFIISRTQHFPTKVKGHAGTRHSVRFSPSALKEELSSEVDVNSYHDYGFESVPSEFEVLAKCPKDQTIEAIHDKKNRIAAVMWHPEREPKLTTHDRILISKFLHLDSETSK